MSINTPPSTTLSQPPSPTELEVSHLKLDEEGVEKRRPSSHEITKTITTTIQPIFMRPKPIYVMVATTSNPAMGIGHRGKLPWPGIRADMAFFKNVTSHVPGMPETASTLAGTKLLNAVVMGRKTWQSIPVQFRPLAGRLNVIITRSDSQELGKKILQELKAPVRGEDSIAAWEMHPLVFPKGRSTPKTNRLPPESSTILMPTASTVTKSEEISISPIVISPSLHATLSLLSSPVPIQVRPTSTKSTSASNSKAALEDPPLALSINKIYCIGGAEIYRQILALSSHSLQTPTTSTGAATGSETGTDSEGESSIDRYRSREGGEMGDHFDVRILQTQIRKIPGKGSASPGSSHHQDRRNSKVEEADFECDTFFPDLLPSPNSGVKSAKWRHVPQSKLVDWVKPNELPQYLGRRKQSVQDAIDWAAGAAEEEQQDEQEIWWEDEKAGVEIRVVGWEQR